jgi:hypothetical protein
MAKQRRKVAAAFRRMAGGVDSKAAYASTAAFYRTQSRIFRRTFSVVK